MSDRATLVVERRRQARVLRHEGAGAGARRDRARRNADEIAGRRRVELARRAHPVVQMIRADQDRNFTFREAFDVAGDKFVKLADETMRDLDVAPDGRWAVGPRHARLHLGLQAGRRRHLSREHDDRRAHADVQEPAHRRERRSAFRPTATTSSIWKDSKYQAYDLDAGTTKTLGGTAPLPLANTEYDHPGAKPSYGIAGYTSDGKSVIVAERYDLWALPLDGSAREEPDERRRHEERDSLPLRAHRAGRSGGGRRPAAVAARRRPRRRDARRSICPSRSRSRPTASGRRRRASTSSPTASCGKSSTRTRRSAIRRRRRRPTSSCSRGRRSSSSPICASRAPNFKDVEEDHATRIRSRPSTSGAIACCSTSRTSSAIGCRASSRSPTTTSRARSGRCS